jgi:sugar phosphate isomerase/epimerase
VRSLVERTGVRISALGYYPNPLAPDPAERQVHAEHIQAMIDAARLLNLSTVNTFVGRDPSLSIDDNWPLFREVWPPLVAYAAERDINIGIENCPMLFTADEWPGGKNLAISPAVWRRMFEEIPDPHFGLNYDPSHMIWQQMDEIRPIEDFAARLHHAHAKDARLDRRRLGEVGILAVPLAFHTPKLPGLGSVRWGAFFSALNEVGYAGPVCVEVEDRAFEGSLEDRKRALRQSARYLRQFV